MIRWIFGLLVLSVFACEPAQEQPLQIAVAANLRYAAEEIVAAFEAEKGYNTQITLGSSGKLTTQISQGAPFHVFLSADVTYPQSLIDAGHAMSPINYYAKGDLAIWSMREDLPMHDPILSLGYPSVRAIGIANPKVAPYGQMTKEWLELKMVWDSLETRIVYGESIGQVNQYIKGGIVDIGITSLSTVMHEQIGSKGKWARLSLAKDKLLEQGAVITQYGQQRQPKVAEQFMTFLKSEGSRQILAKYGYLVE